MEQFNFGFSMAILLHMVLGVTVSAKVSYLSKRLRCLPRPPNYNPTEPRVTAGYFAQKYLHYLGGKAAIQLYL